MGFPDSDEFHDLDYCCAYSQYCDVDYDYGGFVDLFRYFAGLDYMALNRMESFHVLQTTLSVLFTKMVLKITSFAGC